MSDSILQIRPVEIAAAKLVIGLAGTSGSGKTYSALLLAYGLAGRDASKVGLICTENGRGSLYARMFDTAAKKQPFMIGNLSAPYSPERYRMALDEFAQTGIEAIVVDSMSHEWEGEGSCDEIAHRPKANGQPRNIPDWITAKKEHHRFMRALLNMPCHVIPCFRARDKTNFKDPKNPVPLGVQPICERSVMYEMTASFMLYEGGHREPMKTIPDFFPFLQGDGYFTIEHGEKMREWAGGVDATERTRNLLRLAAGKGSDALRNEWVRLDKPTQRLLNEFKDTLKDLAAHADAERLALKGDNGAPEIGGRDMTPAEEANSWR